LIDNKTKLTTRGSLIDSSVSAVIIILGSYGLYGTYKEIY